MQKNQHHVGMAQLKWLFYVELKKLLISNEYESNPCSYEHNLSSSENMALKKNQATRGLNP